MAELLDELTAAVWALKLAAVLADNLDGMLAESKAE
jgi:hypothetical protein